MESRVKLLGHAIHPMLVVFPLGLLATACIFDIVYLVTGGAQWAGVSYWLIVAGTVSGPAAALFGWVDWFAIPSGTRAKTIGLTHGIGNMVIVLLFAGSWYLRWQTDMFPGSLALVLSFAGVGMALVTAWLGGELVGRLHVGVDEGAHLNAPSSLTTPASEITAREEDIRLRKAG